MDYGQDFRNSTFAVCKAIIIIIQCLNLFAFEESTLFRGYTFTYM